MKHVCQHRFKPDGKMDTDAPILTADQLQAAWDRLTAANKERNRRYEAD